jgi:putative SOS response-associated peptidase YedK
MIGGGADGKMTAMCGRYNLAGLTWTELWHLMSAGPVPAGWNDGRDVQSIQQSYNVAPTQIVPLIRLLKKEGGVISPAMARWGLIPAWFRKGLKEWKANTINARVETVAGSPSFRAAYMSGRCIVPMAGYYEWSTRTKPKQAHYLHQGGNEPALLVLGLWTGVSLPDYEGLTCAILTEPAEGAVAGIHDRQPVIVDREGARLWLEGRPIADIPRLPTSQIVMQTVGNAVNSWRAQGPDLILPQGGDEGE